MCGGSPLVGSKYHVTPRHSPPPPSPSPNATQPAAAAPAATGDWTHSLGFFRDLACEPLRRGGKMLSSQRRTARGGGPGAVTSGGAPAPPHCTTSTTTHLSCRCRRTAPPAPPPHHPPELQMLAHCTTPPPPPTHPSCRCRQPLLAPTHQAATRSTVARVAATGAAAAGTTPALRQRLPGAALAQAAGARPRRGLAAAGRADTAGHACGPAAPAAHP